MDRAGILAALDTEANELDAYLASLTPADLTRQSACDAWSVADVIAHLAMAGSGYVATIGRALAGPAAEEGPRPFRYAPDAYAASVKQSRQEMGDGLLPALREANAALRRSFVALSPEEWQQRTRLGRVSAVAWLRLLELSLHGWDIRYVLDPPGHLSATAVPVLLASMAQALHWRLIPDEAQTAPLRLKFEWTDPSLIAYELALGPDTLQFRQAATGPVDVTVRCAPEVAVLLFMGRLDVSIALRRFGMQVEGDAVLAELITTRFRQA